MTLFKKTKIILADDHELILTGLEAIIALDPSLQIIAKCLNGKELIDKAKNNVFDLIISDFSMPLINGLEAIKEIKKFKPNIKSILLTGFDEHEYIKGKLNEYEINGFVKKTSINSELMLVIEKVLNKDNYQSQKSEIIHTPILPEKSIVNHKDIKNDKNNPFSTLTKREFEFAKYLSMGYKYKEIAELMGSKVSTLETYRNKLSKKIGVTSTIDIIKLAHIYGIVKTEGLIGLKQ